MNPESTTHLSDRFVHLRELLRTATEFIVPWHYFHDELAMRADFIALGERGESTLIDAAVEAASKKFGLTARDEPMFTVHIREYGFWHGMRHFGDRTGIFFFDENIGQGLLGVMKDLTGGPVDLFRFTTVAFEKTGAVFPMNARRGGPPQ